MSMNVDDEKKILPDSEACYEAVASEEEVYLELTEEEVRAVLTSDPATAEQSRSSREKLESDWELKISRDGCK
jgi:hypothetical protein